MVEISTGFGGAFPHATAFAAVGGPFTLMRFGEPDLPDIVYLEQLNSALYLNKDVDVMNYLQIMNRLAAGALTPQRSTELITSVRAAL